MQTIMTNYLSFCLTTNSPLTDRLNRSGNTSVYSAPGSTLLGFNDISQFVQPNIGKYLCQGTRFYFHAGTNSLFTNYPNIRRYIFLTTDGIVKYATRK